MTRPPRPGPTGARPNGLDRFGARPNGLGRRQPAGPRTPSPEPGAESARSLITGPDLVMRSDRHDGVPDWLRHPPVDRVYQTSPAHLTPSAPTGAAMVRPVADTAPPVPAAPVLPTADLDRLDRELWRRFEKRVRIERERRGNL